MLVFEANVKIEVLLSFWEKKRQFLKPILVKYLFRIQDEFLLGCFLFIHFQSETKHVEFVATRSCADLP